MILSEQVYVLNPNQFNSKILLFGEYAIIQGGKGLALPFAKFFGELKQCAKDQSIHTTLQLGEFASYLKNSGLISSLLDVDKFALDVADGLYFDSNIPLGHGVGSSGALCASIYAQYAYDFTQKENYSAKELKILQDRLALMESFYHGTSSGFDCLISLVNRPILVENRNQIKSCSKPKLKNLGHFYLYNTETARKTSPLVHQFLAKLDRDLSFKKQFEQFKQLNDETIALLLENDKEAFIQSFAELSKLQLAIFSDIIPRNIQKLWLDGVESEQFYMKLCGAGNGGFFLIFNPYDIMKSDNLISLNESLND